MVPLTEDEVVRLQDQAVRWGATEEGRIIFARKFEVAVGYLARLASGVARPHPGIARMMLTFMEGEEM
jgi:hypothetical protein